MSTATFKVFFATETRRFKAKVNFDSFVAKLEELFDKKNLSLRWKDSDGDLITLSSDDDLQEAVNSQTGVVKVYANEQAAQRQQQQEVAQGTLESEQPRIDEKVSKPAPPPVAAKPKPIIPVEHRHVTCDGSNQSPLLGTRYHKIGANYDLNEEEFAKLPESVKWHFEVILRPGATPIPYEPVAHYGVTCDASEMYPIMGLRFHKIGEDYDLCQAEFAKLDEKEKRKYELINHPRSAPVPYYKDDKDGETVEVEIDLGKIMSAAGFLFPGLGPFAHHGRRGRCQRNNHWQRCGEQQQQKPGPAHCNDHNNNRHRRRRGDRRNDHPNAVAAGNILPNAGVRFGSFGPGVEQLQRFLIEHGMMDESAIRWRAGVYAWRTQKAVAEFQTTHKLDVPQGSIGQFDELTRTALLSLVATSTTTKKETKTEENEERKQSPAPAYDSVVVVNQEQQEGQDNVDTVDTDNASEAQVDVDDLDNNNNNNNNTDNSDSFIVLDAPQSSSSTDDDDAADDEVYPGKDLEQLKREQEAKRKAEEEAVKKIVQEQNEAKRLSEEKKKKAQLQQQKWTDELMQLESMGFVDEEVNIKLLKRFKGNVNRVVARLLE